ncbi:MULTISPECIES: family 10 glycosylhydrolase [unclassified Dysgonomonas]|uniref:family 10 glycosylhydrolase n=1 Tax=unclassified Dysgonomonas TaxID=2630389 RepID=UPI0025BEBCE1|nr:MULTISPECIES: family 10 glycosylhydrolase [unclassified Dysgonomonas]MDR2002330.1 family 10 glycosylhydrolase [Prevotella sp.]HMM01760.1 family 10 glycosylhydrolase [Dysgonomonas sp.]
MRNILILFFIVFVCTACSNKEKETDTGKPKILWLDAEANFKRFSDQDSIRFYLDLAKNTGFNGIVVDVRPMEGDVLYKSKILKPLTTFGDGYVYERNWDYLQFFIDEARKRNMKVTVSAGILPAGLVRQKTGTAYEDTSWNDKVCIAYTPDGLKSMKETSEYAVFLNPALTSVQTLVSEYVSEIISNYDFDAFTLDYCRFCNANYDFSDSTRVAFEKFIGKKVERFPEDIFTYNDKAERVPGKYYKQWWEFRSTTITNLISSIRKTIKDKKPNMKLNYWAASWIHSIYGNGQNWGSKKHYDPSEMFPEWASETYKNTGFADQLDVFMLGSYLYDVYGLDNNESIEYAIDRAYKLIGDDCEIYGTVYGENNIKNMEDAVYVCLTQSAGLMVFDIVQVIKYNMWDDIKRGIGRAEGNNN